VAPIVDSISDFICSVYIVIEIVKGGKF